MSGLFKKPKIPKPPKPELPIPVPDEEEIRRAKKKSYLARRSRSGRASTILSDSYLGDTLG